MIADDLLKTASSFVELSRQKNLRLATAESCTGGLLATVITDIAGTSEIFDCGFVTYSNDSKIKMLGVDPKIISQCGAVSPEVATAMAEGALIHSKANISVSTTGIAGPTGATSSKPVGLVYLAVAQIGKPTVSEVCHFGNIGRSFVREATVKKGLSLLINCITEKS